ncbi:YecH family protein [Flavobacteriaceae bacterium D16]|nr:YecH family protein [Flavobacteriaceae bacterium D16]
MENIKHIHEVIFLIEKNNQQWTPKELIEAIETSWGPDIHFESCSGNAFPKENALDFLINRQKAVLSKEGKVALHHSMQICDGHEGF